MEQAIISIGGLILVVMLYQDRARRSDNTALRQDNAALRQDMNAGFSAQTKATDDLRKDMNAGFAAEREATTAGFAAEREATTAGLDNLRKEMKADMNAGFGAQTEATDNLRKEMHDTITVSATRTDTRVNELTTAMIDLAKSLGRVEGRTEVLAAAE